MTVKFNKENLKCHNKYFYAFKDYPEKTIITIDDDLQYNHRSISGLIKKNKEYPKCITYNLGSFVIKNRPFKSWPDAICQCTPHIDIYPLGVGDYWTAKTGIGYKLWEYIYLANRDHICVITDKEVFDKEETRDFWANFFKIW